MRASATIGLLGGAVVSAVLAAACGPSAPVSTAPADAGVGVDAADAGGYAWSLPPGFPVPHVPKDNPMTAAKVELGRHLFYDKRLSGNGTQSCASCHEQKLAFTDGKAHAVGSTGEENRRGAMALANVGYMTTLTWANGTLDTLEKQVLVPMFGETPIELGLAGKDVEMLARLRAEPKYAALFHDAYPSDADPFVLVNVVRALTSFERALVSGNSAYDRYVYQGQIDALSSSAKRGKDLFFGEKLECFHCHGGFAFQDAVAHEGTKIVETFFHNTGLYNLDGNGAYPAVDRGLLDVTNAADDMGRFRAPPLRNIAVTAPYMHDGTIATLSEALDHYAAGGRTITGGPNAGDGSKSPLKSELIAGFTLDPQERADVLAFLESLTDDDFLHDPRFADPWTSK